MRVHCVVNVCHDRAPGRVSLEEVSERCFANEYFQVRLKIGPVPQIDAFQIAFECRVQVDSVIRFTVADYFPILVTLL